MQLRLPDWSVPGGYGDDHRRLCPIIPGQLLVQIFITKEEKKALGISEHNTIDWRRQNNIPDTDGIELGQTRKRSDTVSTAHSDSHDQKRNRLQEIQE
jgi:hypothetical protein